MTRSWVEPAVDQIHGDDGDDQIWVGLSAVFADSVDGGRERMSPMGMLTMC